MTWNDVVAIGLPLPGVEVSTSYGTPALKVGTKFLTRLRTEDDSIVLTGVPVDEREALIEANPAVYFTTPHYDGYPSVLVRLAAVDPATVRHFFERRWRAVASKRAVAAFDAAHAAD